MSKTANPSLSQESQTKEWSAIPAQSLNIPQQQKWSNRHTRHPLAQPYMVHDSPHVHRLWEPWHHQRQIRCATALTRALWLTIGRLSPITQQPGCLNINMITSPTCNHLLHLYKLTSPTLLTARPNSRNREKSQNWLCIILFKSNFMYPNPTPSHSKINDSYDIQN
jgi:hypothetical protein